MAVEECEATTVAMKHFSPLCSQWHGQVKQLFTKLHGHQSKVLAMFVLGAIKAESIVVARVAEELLSESDAKVPSLERRLQRFLSNERIEVEAIGDHFLAQVLPSFGQQALTLILDIPTKIGLARTHDRAGGADRFERDGDRRGLARCPLGRASRIVRGAM